MFALSSPVADTAEILTSLRRLVAVRWWVLALAVAAVLAAPPVLGIVLPRWPMLMVIVLVAVWNHLSARRLAAAAGAAPAELFSQLCLDLMLFAVLLFFSGGATNPLISLLLPPVAVAALTLSPRLVATVAALAVAVYSVLMMSFVPLPFDDPARAARLHLLGMWLTFVVSVALIAWLILHMTNAIRRRDAELANAREQALRDERVLALGTLAAGAAHELGTPLATMAVLAGELEHDAPPASAARADLALLREQIGHCKRIISGLAERAGAQRAECATSQRCDEWLESLHAGWLALRGDVASHLDIAGNGPAPQVVVEPTLEQAIINLLNNAARTGTTVALRVRWDERALMVEVGDRGPGFPAEVLRDAGTAPFPPHATGSGIGLLLTRAAIERLGGRLALSNPPAGGAQARIEMPLVNIASLARIAP